MNVTFETLFGYNAEDGVSFSPGWTHVVCTYNALQGSTLLLADATARLVLFYNAVTGAGSLGRLDTDGYSNLRNYAPGSFTTDWTHIVPTANGGQDESFFFYYNKYTGAAALGYIDPKDWTHHTPVTWEPGHFSSGWDHVVFEYSNALFYDSWTGKAAYGQLRFGNFTNSGNYGEGSFAKGWTQLIRTSGGLIFFYNSNDGSAAVGAFRDQKFVTLLGEGPGRLPSDYYLASSFMGILCYNPKDGSGAVEIVEGLIDVVHETVRHWDSGYFSLYWTHIVGNLGGVLLFYNSGTGSGAVGILNWS